MINDPISKPTIDLADALPMLPLTEIMIVGLLNLSGKSVEDAEKYLMDQFGRIYATLKKPHPSTYMDISLGQLRSINVNFVREIKYSGVYHVHHFSNVLT